MAKWSARELSSLQKIWRECKNLDYREVNKRAQFPFEIILWGDETQVLLMQEWLGHPKNSERVRTISDKTPMEESLKASLAKATFVLKCGDKQQNLAGRFYDFDECRNELEKVLLNDFPELSFAFSYHLPRFRAAHAKREIRSTALQNMSWAVSSSLPNILPGPHQLATAPLEGASDFLVMTANEIKLMFELTAVSGQKVELFKSWGQLAIVLGMAKLAQMSATQLVSKIPAGGGVIAKGATAFAFSTAIGEALFLYVTTGERKGKEFFQERIPALLAEGREWARQKLGKK